MSPPSIGMKPIPTVLIISLVAGLIIGAILPERLPVSASLAAAFGITADYFMGRRNVKSTIGAALVAAFGAMSSSYLFG